MIELSNMGEIDILSYFVNKSTPENIKVKLFVNNMIPKKDYTVHNFIELNPGFYDDVLLDPKNWEVKYGKIENTDIETNILHYPNVLFNVNGYVGKIYGYYGVGVSSGKLKFYSAFNEPKNVNVEGASLNLSLNLLTKQFINNS